MDLQQMQAQLPSMQAGPTNLEQAIERESRRAKPIPKLVVRTVEDIRRLLAEFDPTRDSGVNEVDVKSTISIESSSGKSDVPISAKCVGKSRRRHIIEAFEAIKTAIEKENKSDNSVLINGKNIVPARVPMRSYIDPIVEQWFDAKRDGTLIYWELNDGYRYNYDPITHRLTRTERKT
jgi:hypothetical protein